MKSDQLLGEGADISKNESIYYRMLIPWQADYGKKVENKVKCYEKL